MNTVPSPLPRSPQVLDEAYAIAWDYLVRSGQVKDEGPARAVLCQLLFGLWDKGVAHRILLANRAISAFERLAIPSPSP